MDNLEIRLYGDSLLWKKSKKVDKIDNSLKSLINDMAEKMYQHKGVGLAAPQIGILKRIIIVDIGEGLTVLANPKIITTSGKQIASEGCLSIPGIYLDIERAEDIIVEGLDEDGVYTQIEAKGLFARVLQHEIDHLEGVLIIDRVPKKRIKSLKQELENIKNRII